MNEKRRVKRMQEYDYLIIGGGIIGLTIANELTTKIPEAKVCILEKEANTSLHASGRNSGVIHAGFYYTADSLKAKFTRDGNRALRNYCKSKKLRINECGKIVVAVNEKELSGLAELKKRADTNGVELHWLSEAEAIEIEPRVKTYQKALYSPTTATVDPVEVCESIKQDILNKGVTILLNTQYKGFYNERVVTNNGTISAKFIINAAGLYAERIASDFNFGKKFTIIPFKGLYLKYEKNKTDLRTNIYPVPNLANPFLGVHFTKTVDGSIKIGPTAIPSFWRENYKGFHRFKLDEAAQILSYEARLFLTNSFNFRNLAITEMKKYLKSNLIKLSLSLVNDLDKNGFGKFTKPGIRAQLMNKQTMELVQDFVVEGDDRSIHILNAVSPAFTCSFPFATYVVEQILQSQRRDRIEIS